MLRLVADAGVEARRGLAGLLAGLPGLSFALAGLLAIGLARRVGLPGVIGWGLAAAAAGVLLRASRPPCAHSGHVAERTFG